MQEFINSRSSFLSAKVFSGLNRNLHCYRRIDINDSNTKKVTITYSDTKWHAKHISSPSQLQVSSTKYGRSTISQSHLHNCFNALPHRPISTIFKPIAALIVSTFNTKKPAHQHPKTHHLPNPLQTLSPPTDWVTSVQWTCAPWALNIPVMHRVATTLWP